MKRSGERTNEEHHRGRGKRMWFRLETASLLYGTNVYMRYCKELSTFNVRILNVPQLRFFGISLNMDVLVLVELDTLEDFIRLRDSLCKPLVLHENDDKLIEIYDDWRE